MTTATIYSTPTCVKCKITTNKLLTKFTETNVNKIVLDTPEKIEAFKKAQGVESMSMPFVQVKENDQVILSWNDMKPDKINEALKLASSEA